MEISPYYPPRATWSRPWHRLIAALRGFLQRNNLNHWEPPFPSFRMGHVGVFALPGLGFIRIGEVLLGKIAIAVWLFAFTILLTCLGTSISSLAYSAMISIHASSIISYVRRVFPQKTLFRQVLQPLLIVLVIGQLVYPALRWGVEAHAVRAMRFEDRTYWINCLPGSRTTPVQPGDIIGFHFSHSTPKWVSIRDTDTCGRVLAGPGDLIEFSSDAFLVNGKPFPRLEYMPDEGRRIIAENTFFVWPKCTVQIGTYSSREFISEAVVKLAMVQRNDIYGKAFSSPLWHPPSP